MQKHKCYIYIGKICVLAVLYAWRSLRENDNRDKFPAIAKFG